MDGLGRVTGKIGIPVASNVAGKRFLSSRRCKLQVELRVYPPEIDHASPSAVSTLALAWKERGFSKLGEKPMHLLWRRIHARWNRGQCVWKLNKVQNVLVEFAVEHLCRQPVVSKHALKQVGRCARVVKAGGGANHGCAMSSGVPGKSQTRLPHRQIIGNLLRLQQTQGSDLEAAGSTARPSGSRR